MKRSPFKSKRKPDPLKKKAHDLWAKCIKFGKESCEKCHGRDRLQAHHIVTVADKNIAHDLSNGITLCYHCHMFSAHSNYEEFRDWSILWLGKRECARKGRVVNDQISLRRIGQEAMDLLRYRAQQYKKVDYQMEILRLTETLKELQTNPLS
jgi:hypothetical protein